ncbi:MAG: trypsin-like peptidase domain-containing protein [Clostridiales bacterium]|nr:trypsin-like peptidase domain-containing protein [Clostridiales bacterium]
MFYDDDDKLNKQENEQPDQDLKDKDDNSENNTDKQEEETNSYEDKQSSEDDVDEYNNLENRYDGWQSTEQYYEEQRRERGEYDENENKKKDSSVSKKTIGWLVALCIMVSLIAGIGASAILNSLGNKNDTTIVPPVIETTSNATETNNETVEKTTSEVTTGATLVDITTTTTVGDALTPAQIFKKVSSSVVCITTKTSSGASGGSGVVATKDGYIITNYHVANEACTSISVMFYDGSTYSATFVLGDEVADVALVKIEKEDCTPVEIADSTNVEMGDSVVVIGNALGNGLSITSGIVSNINGTFTLNDIATPVIQVDAAINQGNSGGGLFNSNGQLIGIVNAKTGGTLVDGVGYAIPTSNVLKAIQDLQTYGYVTGRAKLGLVSSRGNSSSTEYYLYTYYGLYQVSEITEGGSCYGTDMKVGDILYKIDGQQVSASNLKAILAKYSVGDTVTITVLRPTADISNYKTEFGFRVSYDYTSYLNDCQQIDISVTFVEFN